MPSRGIVAIMTPDAASAHFTVDPMAQQRPSRSPTSSEQSGFVVSRENVVDGVMVRKTL